MEGAEISFVMGREATGRALGYKKIEIWDARGG